METQGHKCCSNEKSMVMINKLTDYVRIVHLEERCSTIDASVFNTERFE